jgi:hypothetical protein
MSWPDGGYAVAVGPCFGCKRTFAFDPDKVPSIPINGEREPICRHCVTRVNPQRKRNGLPPIHVLPGAYPDEDRA